MDDSEDSCTCSEVGSDRGYPEFVADPHCPFHGDLDAEPPVDPGQTIGEAETANRERQESEIRAQNAPAELDAGFTESGRLILREGIDENGDPAYRIRKVDMTDTSALVVAELAYEIFKANVLGSIQ